MNVATRYGMTLQVVEPRWSPLDTAPLPLQTGDRLEIAGLGATLVAPHPGAAHLWFVRIAGDLDAAMAHAGKRVRPTAGFTGVLVHPGRPACAVDGIITGLHDPFTSHLAMLYAIAPAELVRDGTPRRCARDTGGHEFGDSHLIAADRSDLSAHRTAARS